MTNIQRVLIINAGSSSLKVSVYSQRAIGYECIYSCTLKTSDEPLSAIRQILVQEDQLAANATSTNNSTQLNPAPAPSSSSSSSFSSSSSPRLDLILHRVVHGGSKFTAPTEFTPAVLSEFEELNDLAPLHNPPALRWIKACIDAFPGRTRHFGIFDTEFFHHIPLASQIYAIPYELIRKYNLRRYGFHGIAHSYMHHEFCRYRPDLPSGGRLLTLQLGSGCSIAALRNGQPVECSMGFTPNQGLCMSTRSGDIEPGLLAYLMKKENWSMDQLQHMLNYESGYYGLSERETLSMKELEVSTTPAAIRTLDLFVHRILHYIGAYMLLLGGCDGIVFGGGIGEKSPIIRGRLIAHMQHLGVVPDHAANQRKSTGRIVQFIPGQTPIDMWVITVDEAAHMLEKGLKALEPESLPPSSSANCSAAPARRESRSDSLSSRL